MSIADRIAWGLAKMVPTAIGSRVFALAVARATQGEWSTTEVPALTAMEAYKRAFPRP